MMKKLFTLTSAESGTEEQHDFVMSHWQQSNKETPEERKLIENFLQEDINKIRIQRKGTSFTGIALTFSGKEIAFSNE